MSFLKRVKNAVVGGAIGFVTTGNPAGAALGAAAGAAKKMKKKAQVPAGTADMVVAQLNAQAASTAARDKAIVIAGAGLAGLLLLMPSKRKGRR